MQYIEFAIQLIKNYNKEFNRLKRARREKDRVFADTDYLEEMSELGFALVPSLGDKPSAYKVKSLCEYFVVRHPHCNYEDIPKAFTSHNIKSRDMSKAKSYLKSVENSSNYLKFEDRLQRIKDVPVRSDLGKKWRRLVHLFYEEYLAYEDRWAARCAIKAFNKMDTGIKIKFGNCSKGGGSMSYIRGVVVDGFEIPLKKFLKDQEFERALLAA